MKKIINYNWEYPKIFDPVFDFQGRYVLLSGGRDSGKSWYVAQRLLEDCMYKKRDVICAREHQESIDKSAYKNLKNVILKYDLPYRIKRDEIISLTTGSSFVFVGLSDITASNIKSYEGYSYVWLEEAQSISKKSWEYLDPTIRQKNDVKIYITMNPEVSYDKHPITSELTTYLSHKTIHIHSTIYDNPFADPDSLERAELDRINKPDEWRFTWLGEPDNSRGNLIVKGFSKDNIRPLFYQPHLDLHISCDFNYDPMCWVMFHKDQNKMYVFDELIEERTSTQECARKLIERYPDHKGRIILNGDASGMQKNCAHSNPDMTNFLIIKRELERHYHRQVSLEIRKGNPHKIKRFEAFNNLVKRYDGEICFYISDNCKWTIYNIENAKFKEGTKEVDEPTVSAIQKDFKLKFMIHPLDAVTYPAEFYWAIR